MRMGAEIPRYSLEKLANVSMRLVRTPNEVCGRIPFMLDDLPEAVHHAIVALVTNCLAGLKLSAYV